MRSIQQYLPDPRHTEINRIFVKAKPKDAWDAARHFDASVIPWIRLLFDIRTLPEKLAGKNKPGNDHRIGVDQITESGKGFMLLHETAGKEVIVGSVGQFWHLNIPFASVRPGDFRDFSQPGWGKLAWAIVVEPFLEGSTISLELRTTATDEHSWKKLKNYYRIIGLGSRPIRNALMKHFESVLGKLKMPDDEQRSLPGDEIIPGARYSYTHTKNIEAPAGIIWRYLMQLGCDRAGWYSIDLLDHGGVPGINHLVDGWESRNPGERVDATPAKDSFFEVYGIQQEKHFIIGGDGHRLGGDFKMSWAFVLEPIGDDATHLIARVRMKAVPEWSGWLQGNLLAPLVHGLMQHVQLKTIKRLAERDAQLRQQAPVFYDLMERV
ncbi:MAG: SRPBCC family protein [Flavitalea sp.]